jgi:hypothetical protein
LGWSCRLEVAPPGGLTWDGRVAREPGGVLVAATKVELFEQIRRDSWHGGLSVRLGFDPLGAVGFRKHQPPMHLSGAVQRGKQLVSLLTNVASSEQHAVSPDRPRPGLQPRVRHHRRSRRAGRPRRPGRRRRRAEATADRRQPPPAQGRHDRRGGNAGFRVHRRRDPARPQRRGPRPAPRSPGQRTAADGTRRSAFITRPTAPSTTLRRATTATPRTSPTRPGRADTSG